MAIQCKRSCHDLWTIILIFNSFWENDWWSITVANITGVILNVKIFWIICPSFFCAQFMCYLMLLNFPVLIVLNQFSLGLLVRKLSVACDVALAITNIQSSSTCLLLNTSTSSGRHDRFDTEIDLILYFQEYGKKIN